MLMKDTEKELCLEKEINQWEAKTNKTWILNNYYIWKFNNKISWEPKQKKEVIKLLEMLQRSHY